MLSLGSGLSGFSGVLSWPELQLSTRAAGVNVPMACAAKVLSLVSGLWPPVLNETKLRENATNNPGQRCTCSKHGLSLAGMSAPGDLGWQILKTMLRRYEALDGAVVLPLSRRVAHLLSMVFYAKAANPPGASSHRNGKPSLANALPQLMVGIKCSELEFRSWTCLHWATESRKYSSVCLQQGLLHEC